MPKILSYTPAWLSSPGPGHDIFTTSLSKGASDLGLLPRNVSNDDKRSKQPGSRRTLARRGTEVFIAVGKEIRWADLVYLKETWQDKQDKQDNQRQNFGYKVEEEGEEEDGFAQGYRIIKTPVADDIRQLIISPQSNYLAILTAHTVHIALLPDSSHLTAPDTSPLRLKTYTLGPITHVTTQSAISSALWHPLGVNGSCIVTITKDAVVRVWELSPTDRWSFDRPTLAIDLKKLADGTSLDQDFGASVSGLNKSFSPDSIDMEVASACFGGRGSDGWSPMTLWIAMREGDVYALCPLLPERWAPPPTLVPSLSISIVSKVASTEDDTKLSEESKLLTQQQLAWMSDLDNQDPVMLDSSNGEPPAEIFMRPLKPGRIPKLQGPFEFELGPEESNDDLDSMLTDILVVGPKVDAERLMSGEDVDLEVDDIDQEGLSAGIVCLLSSSGRVTVCIDLDGVEAQWLPVAKSKQRRFAEITDPPSLLTFQVIDTLRSEEVYAEGWPTFSPDVSSRYSLFITHLSSVTFLSLAPWIFRLESEFQSNADAGLDFRMDLIVKGQSSIRERIVTQDLVDEENPLAAAVAIRDPDLGYFLLTATVHGPIAVTFESPELEIDIRRSRSPTYESDHEPAPLLIYAPRMVYQPPHIFSTKSVLPSLIENLQRSKYKRIINEPIRLSPATLTILTDAHKILSEETHRLGTAAAELFRQCEQLQIELRGQIGRANEVAGRIEAVTGDDADIDQNFSSGNEAVERRIEVARRRQRELTERVERMKKRLGKGRGKELSDREKLWFEEVATLNAKVFGTEKHNDNSDGLEDSPSLEPWERYEEVKNLKNKLVPQVDKISVANDVSESLGTEGKFSVPFDIRKEKIAQVMMLLERESALVDGTKNRLERLSLG